MFQHSKSCTVTKIGQMMYRTEIAETLPVDSARCHFYCPGALKRYISRTSVKRAEEVHHNFATIQRSSLANTLPWG